MPILQNHTVPLYTDPFMIPLYDSPAAVAAQRWQRGQRRRLRRWRGRGGVVGGLAEDFHGHKYKSLLFTCKYLDVEIGWQGRWLSTLPRGAECLNNKLLTKGPFKDP